MNTLRFFNQPYYFYEFVEQIKKFELGYLTDTSLCLSLNNIIYEEQLPYAPGSNTMDPRIAKEQFTDFATNLSFRKSIIAHKENLKNARFGNKYNKDTLDSLNLLGTFRIDNSNTIDQKNNKINSQNINLVKLLNSAFPGTISIKDFNLFVKGRF